MDVIEPMFINITCGIIANSITGVLPKAIGGLHEDHSSRGIIKEKISNDNAIKNIIHKSIVELKRNIGNVQSPYFMGIKEFLTSTELESTLSQYFSSEILENQDQCEPKIKSILEKIYIYYTKEKNERSKEDFEIILSSLIKSISRAKSLSNFIGIGSAAGNRLLRAQNVIGCLQNKAALWEELKPEEIFEILAFEETYQNQMALRFKDITPPNTGEAIRVKIDEIYVKPSFSFFKRGITPKEVERINYESLITNGHREVILGNPGNGKTTLLHKFCYDLSSKAHIDSYTQKTLTPILVTLREYSSYKSKTSSNIVDFIYHEAKRIAQINVPPKTFEYLLYNGRAVVFFDGLDELIEIGNRNEMCKEIEAFSNLFSSVPVFVTSREVGYENSPLCNDLFNTIKISNFNLLQIREYATNWFKLFDFKHAYKVENRVANFLEESKYADDLIENPLMLALLCSIYKGENYIPENRPEIYKKCAEMLFEKWDKSRNIIVKFPFKGQLKPALMHLANFIYSNQDLHSGVEEKTLVKETKKFLLNYTGRDQEKAEDAAEKFVHFCKGRAWVFSDIGEGIYQFTHRTFLEYFTAYYFVRKSDTPEILFNKLKTHITKSEREVITQLSLQIFNENTDNAVDRFFDCIFDKISNSQFSSNSFNLLKFATKSLKYVCPTTDKIDELTRVIFSLYYSKTIRYERLEDLALTMIDCSVDNIENVINSFLKLIKINFTTEEGKKVHETWELISLPYVFKKIKNLKDNATIQETTKFAKKILSDNIQGFESYVEKNPDVHILTYYLDIRKFGNILEINGPSIILLNPKLLFLDSPNKCICEIIIDNIFNESNMGLVDEFLKELSGHYVDNIAQPVKIPMHHYYDLSSLTKTKEVTQIFSGDTLFGLYIIIMMISEICIEEADFNIIRMLGKDANALSFRRISEGEPLEVIPNIRHSNLTDKQKSLINNWAFSKFSFLRL